MLLSCKVSNALINFLERRDCDLEPLFESFDLPGEFLRDPTYWMEARALENFLQTLDLQFSHLSQESLLTEAGHASEELYSWGVLDSVLRMVHSPQDIFTQPDRFLAYFISPPPPIAAFKRFEDGVEFQVPLSRSEYPYFTEYLSAAMESLPSYVRQPLFHVQWEAHHMRVLWTTTQTTMLDEGEEPNRQLQPEMVRRVLQDLEDQQRKLETVQRELHEKERELKELREKPAVGTVPVDEGMGSTIQDLYKLQDYWSRAAQLVTLLVKQGRMDGQVREAMRRVDWDRIVTDTPHLIHKTSHWLQHMQKLQVDPRRSIDTHPAGEATRQRRKTSSTNLTLPLEPY